MVDGTTQHNLAVESVVSLNQFMTKSFALQISELQAAILSEWTWPSPEAAFAYWLSAKAGIASPLEPGPLHEARWDEAPLLSVGGFMIATGGSKLLESDWIAGFAKLRQRDPLPSDRNTFMFRPIELLGIALGASVAKLEPTDRNWLTSALAASENLLSTDEWTTALANSAAAALGSVFRHCSLQTTDLETYAYRIAEGTEEDSANFLLRAATEGTPRKDRAKAVALWAGLHVTVGTATFTSQSASAPRMIVENVCRRFPIFVSQIKNRHDHRPTISINDEYDVQDALHALLRIHFADVRDEEPSPSHAATSTRLDLLLKNERIVIETKMMRQSLSQKKLLDEIAIDKERYRSHPDCETIIFFVFDPMGLLKNPVALEHDASELIGNVQCQVIVAPLENGASPVMA
jgi:REase_DpnII-MboI